MQDLLSHPLGSLICAGLAWRRGASVLGPLLLGLLLGWGAVPVIWLLTREVRPDDAGDWRETHREPGLTPSEPRSGNARMNWPAHYFALRQKLVLSSLFALVPLPGLGLLILGACLPTMVLLFEDGMMELPLPTRILIFITKFVRTPLGAVLLWLLLALWPACLTLLLQSSYRLPMLGRVWRHCDRIWSLSGIAIPSEVRYRSSSQTGEENLETERAALDEATAHTRIIQRLALLSWLLTLGLIVTRWFFPLYHLVGNIH